MYVRNNQPQLEKTPPDFADDWARRTRGGFFDESSYPRTRTARARGVRLGWGRALGRRPAKTLDSRSTSGKETRIGRMSLGPEICSRPTASRLCRGSPAAADEALASGRHAHFIIGWTRDESGGGEGAIPCACLTGQRGYYGAEGLASPEAAEVGGTRSCRQVR